MLLVVDSETSPEDGAAFEREVAGLREQVGEREEELARIRESLSPG